MKQIHLFFLCTATLLCTTVYAQQGFTSKPGLDIRLGYGLVPVQNLQESFSSSLVPDLTNAAYTDVKKKGSGMFSASLQYQTKGRFGVGVDVVYGKTNTEFVYSNTSTNTVTSSWFTVMAKGTFLYYRDALNVPNIELYGAAAVGSSFSDANSTVGNTARNKNSSYLAYQFTPLGIRTGQKIGFWAELGYGFKGLLNAGISVRL